MDGNRRTGSSIYRFLRAALVLLFAETAWAGPGAPGISDGFSANLRALSFVEAQFPALSTQNPENAFLHLHRYSAAFELRPDLYYDGPAASAVFKPRFTSTWRWWEDGAPEDERDRLTKAFVNEWRVQAAPHGALFLSIGKEKLLWGPAFLASPSNILFENAEKTDPKAEVEGRHLAKMLYLSSGEVTITALTGTERDDAVTQGSDDPLRAVKLDWVGASAAVSLVGYARRDGRLRLGSYGQWTASDGLLLYYDGIVTRGTDGLYPSADPVDPLGGQLVERYDGSRRLYPTVVAGGGYTFLSGSTVSMEFLYNRPGYGDTDAEEYYRLRAEAGDHYFDGGPLAGLSSRMLGGTAETGLLYLRRYYLMGQYQVREAGEVMDLIVRYVHGIEERAGQASAIIEWKLTDRLQLFSVAMMSIDRGKTTEFNAVLDRRFLAGVEHHF